MERTLRYYAATWAQLRAWGRPVRPRLELKTTYDTDEEVASGAAWPGLNVVLLRHSHAPVAALNVLLHEMAHIAAPLACGHGAEWKRIYAAAVHEITGRWVPWDVCQQTLTQLCQDAVEIWWSQSSGPLFHQLMCKGDTTHV